VSLFKTWKKEATNFEFFFCGHSKVSEMHQSNKKIGSFLLGQPRMNLKFERVHQTMELARHFNHWISVSDLHFSTGTTNSKMNWSPRTLELDLTTFENIGEPQLQFLKDNFHPRNTKISIRLTDLKWIDYLHSIFDRVFLGKTSLEFIIENENDTNCDLLKAINICIQLTMKNQHDSMLDTLRISCPLRNDLDHFCNHVTIPPCRKFTWVGTFLPKHLIRVL